MRSSAVAIVAAFGLSAWFIYATAHGQPSQQPAPLTKEGVEFFEKHIRPVLAEHCYECHSTQSRKLKGQLLLDSQPGISKGGAGGAVLIPGDVEKSRLIQAVRWTDNDLAMPPKGKLSPQQIERLEQWVKMGAPDPRTAAATAKKSNTLDIDAGRKWWAFLPVVQANVPVVKQEGWPRKKADFFILKELEARQLSPSPAADARTLIQRLYLDLTGLRPSYQQAEAFASDPSDKAYEQIVEQLLASEQYGQRWGRYWLDVARFGEDNPTSEATNRPYPYAWRYRDWVIEALNRDVPYNQFVTLQLAADLIPKTPRSDLVATGYLGAGPIYHKDGRLSKDVIENLYMDDWDEGVDAVSRGVLGLTVACARCHDHKFDPISTRDYYALAGVFASTVAAPRPLTDVAPEVETRFMVAAQRLFYTSYLANLMRDEPGTNPKYARQKVEQLIRELEGIEVEIADLRQHYPALHAYLARLDKRPKPYEPAAGGKQPAAKGKQGKGKGAEATEPFFHGVFDAGLWVDGNDTELTLLDVKSGQPRDLRVLAGGNVASPGEVVPRGFLSVLTQGDTAFQRGSGRLELAERIFSDAAPRALAARVIVNRVWGWHFGKPLVDTPSDFGTQGDRPSHPELLDDLAARFIAAGWSLKWLHREIVLSAAYRQASRPRPEAVKIDPANRLLWRMHPRRLDIEAFRDCILQSTGSLDPATGGPSTDIDQLRNKRRTVYARVSRGRVNNTLLLYGFPEPTMHSPGRETTTSPLQQLFVMNSPFIRDQAAALVESVAKESSATAKVRAMYRKVLSRDPTERELALAADYLAAGTMLDYAHALLCTNEVIYWP
jgi:hypothetical protein